MPFVIVLFYLYAMHALLDYPLQGDFIAREKANFGSPFRPWVLTGHAAIHGAGVAIVTENGYLGLAEAVCHLVIDEAKNRNWTNIHADQALHVVCKIAWAAFWFVTRGGN